MKTLEETKPQRTANITTFIGNGGFTYVTVPWIIRYEDEGKRVTFGGQEFVPVMADASLGTTTFILGSEVNAWTAWVRGD
jgi:hypothetical protein